MKITITPSQQRKIGAAAGTVYCAVSVEHPYDDLDAAEAVRLMTQALIAWGYAESTIEELIGRD